MIRALLQRVLNRRPAKDPHALTHAPIPTLTPPVCVVGDLHGRLDLLERLLEKIAALPPEQTSGLRMVFVGDMIDRGPDSAGVLRKLHRLSTQTPQRYVCLMGNHERMMLDFLNDPERHGARWLASGGDATLDSFGISPWARTPMLQLAAELRAALTPPLETWIQTLPLYWQSGTVAATHAGAAPNLMLDAQPAHRLLWGAKGRKEGLRQDGLCIVQGHDIVAQAGLQAGRVMVDTGAWRSGRLSAAFFDATGLSIFEVNTVEKQSTPP